MDTQAVLDMMREVAAQVVNPRFRDLADEQVMEKNPGDLVTVADQEAEKLITAALLADDPGVLVVGEEATALDPDLPGRLAGAAHAYTVDPIDGTKNFVHGSPDHAVMISELRDGEVVRAWIHQPAHDVDFVAERGAGVRRNGERLPQFSAPERVVACASSPSLVGEHGGLTLENTAWSCGIDYPWLATGRVHALLYTRGLPWDHAPGSLFTEELGGVVRFLDGTRYLPAVHDRTGLLAACSAEVWDTLAPAIRPLLDRG